jgi:hypothetical protein
MQSGKEQIMNNKELLFDIFDYVITGEDSKPVAPCPPATTCHKKYYCKKRSHSESVGMNPPKLLSQSDSSESSENSCMSMRNLLAKVESFALEEKDMWRAVDLLKSDAMLRKVVLGLSDGKAKGYLLHVIQA